MSPYIFLLCAEILGIYIRNNKDIKGICIDKEIYKISQYADDTSILLDGSAKSLYSSLYVLDYYAKISGLKINFSKTQVIWIGSKKFSKEIFHHSKWKLNWGSQEFTLLGINFSVTISEIESLNYDNKLLEINKLIKSWNRRNLTVLGRITILKSLILSKLTFLLLCLPNPSSKFVDDLNSTLFQFIWQSKVDRIKRNVMIQNYEEGGVKMINLDLFLKSLKVSWIRRFLYTNTKWYRLLETICNGKLDNIFKLGPEYISELTDNLNNKFWLDVFNSWNFLLIKLPLLVIVIF